MKQFQGTVVATKMNHTVIIKVDSLWQHPIYKKRVTRSHRYPVHADIPVKVGDTVIFQETRPLSKTKKWRIIKVVKP